MEWQSLLDSWLFFSWNCWYHGDFLTSSWLFGLGERSPFVPRLRGDGHQTTGQISQEQLPFSHEPSFLCFWLQGAPFFFEHVFFSGKLKKIQKVHDLGSKEHGTLGFLKGFYRDFPTRNTWMVKDMAHPDPVESQQKSRMFWWPWFFYYFLFKGFGGKYEFSLVFFGVLCFFWLFLVIISIFF